MLNPKAKGYLIRALNWAVPVSLYSPNRNLRDGFGSSFSGQGWGMASDSPSGAKALADKGGILKDSSFYFPDET